VLACRSREQLSPAARAFIDLVKDFYSRYDRAGE